MVALAAGLGHHLLQPNSYESEILLSFQKKMMNPAKLLLDVEERIIVCAHYSD